MSEVRTLANSDYNSWRNRLIAILSKHGKSTSQVSGWTGTTVSVGQSMTNKQMSDISRDMIQSSATLCHVPYFSSLDIGDYSVGAPTLLNTKTKIEAKLSEMEAVCHHNVNYNNNSVCSCDGQCSRNYSSDCSDNDNHDRQNEEVYRTGDSGYSSVCSGVGCDGYDDSDCGSGYSSDRCSNCSDNGSDYRNGVYST